MACNPPAGVAGPARSPGFARQNKKATCPAKGRRLGGCVWRRTVPTLALPRSGEGVAPITVGASQPGLPKLPQRRAIRLV